ncbi:Mor transcription activator family protein [Parachitinimonas caeni]|uniref:Mor transcription activator family protein n=1 Tax=Parachitinimonas caeni TaxID=3031301 RepID=A0ABT7DWV9_9NEIS|nr:Mor transcription activator family protein [Parachitinimonas caeni]MDK2124469.1 Mor transcription activator family protein [Parachitinimonas caeni]
MNDKCILEPYRHLLPDTAQLLVSLLGLTPALKLCEHFGGTTLIVPKGLLRAGQARQAELAELIGEPAALALSKHYGGDKLYVPRCAAALRHIRDQQICADFDRSSLSANQTIANLALEHRLSDKRIRVILKSTVIASGVRSAQGELF